MEVLESGWNDELHPDDRVLEDISDIRRKEWDLTIDVCARDGNRAADSLVKWALSCPSGLNIFNSAPQFLNSYLYADMS